MENILVAGANGNTGKQIINLLAKSQYFKPVAMVREESQIEQFKIKGIDAVLGDLEKDISHTVKGIDKVIFAAGSGGKKVVEVDQEGAKKLIDASNNANIKKFVMLSSMGADEPGQANELQEYLQAKHNADEYLKKSNLRYAIVRPGSLTNDDAKGTIEIAKKLGHRGEISRADVAQTLICSLHDNGPSDKTYEILNGETSISEALDSMVSEEK
ncbi:SDR family oxidoreductase [Allomuricauda sp. d1]|uniref:SDR family oxidoreductase n=1 Tax=Allomuricauda sp. d1 TaxID=3136725 RepID=UPI0031D5B735